MLAPLPDFKALARDIQNRNNHIIGTDQMEARHFREFFGTSLIVVEKVWEMLETNFLLPDGCGLACYVGCRRVIFVAQMATGDILCHVGDMSRHVAGHVADTRKCFVGRVSKTTRHLTTCRGIPVKNLKE